MNLDQAIKKIISDNGADILKERRFVSLLSDYQAFGQLPYAANMLRQIYANGYGTKIHKLYLSKDKTETAAFLSELRNKLGFDIEMLAKVLYAFSLPVQRIGNHTQRNNSKSTITQNTIAIDDMELIDYEGKPAYKDEYGGIYSHPNGEIFYKLDNIELAEYTIRQGTKVIDKFAFSHSKSGVYIIPSPKPKIRILTLPNTITMILNYCFAGCKQLVQINLPNSLSVIGERAFYQCDSLMQITIPNSVTVIGEGAFSDSGLRSISLPVSFLSDNINALGLYSKCSILTTH